MSDPNTHPRVAPGPKGGGIFGALWEFHEDPIGLLERNAETYGDVTRFRFFHMPVYQVVHPDDVRTVLVDSEGAFVKGIAMEAFRPLVGTGLLVNEGESHRRQRRMMQPAFHKQRVVGYGEEMLLAAQAIRDTWTPGQEVDMEAEMSRLTLRIAARTLFGAGISDEDAGDVAAAVAAFTQWYHQSTHPLGALLQRLPTRATRELKGGKGLLNLIVDEMIAARRAGGDTGDILSMLVFARDAEGDGAAMDDEHIRDEAVTLLIAGHETTGATLAWAWWLLSCHPEVADRLAAEVNAATGGAPPTVADLPRLSYAEGVFAETLRLYPSAVSLPRQATRDVVLGGFSVPKGAIVMPATWCTHRDPRWWEEPLAFRPERWTAEERAKRPKYAYFPFSGGARVCIGEAFAWMEGTLVLATLAQRWRARLRPGHTVTPEALFTLRPKEGLPMTLERRG